MSSFNTKPIHIQVRDIHCNLIENAKIKVIERKSGKILYNEKSPNGEVILDDIESLKNCHAFRVEIEHPHYKSTPKTLASCIRESCKDKFHTLEFPYQTKLLVSSIYAEIKEIGSKESKTPQQENCPNHNANTLCLPTRTYNFDTNTIADQEAIESLQHIQIHLKAYYNQDTIPNKDKQSTTQQQIYQNQKKQTKWGYITSSPYQHTTKENISSPIKEHETFRILTDLDGNEIRGEEIIINLKEEWLDKQIRFFAFIENPKYEVGITLYIYSPMQYKEEGLIDVSGYIVGFFAGTKAKAAYQFGYSAINAIANLGQDNTKTIDNIPIQTLSNQAARRWYNDKLNTIENPYRTIQDLRQQAEKLHELRNTTKQQARELMQDRIMAWRLNIDPRTKIKPFEYYVKKYSKKGENLDEVYRKIIDSSKRTNDKVNKKYLK